MPNNTLTRAALGVSSAGLTSAAAITAAFGQQVAASDQKTETVTVTDQRLTVGLLPEKLLDTPQSVNVIPAQVIKEQGAVYLNAIGGAAQFYARSIKTVDGVSLLDFGTPEAMWHLTVEDFPAIVTMDAHGNSLHADIEKATGEVLETLK